jgi:hypothetical protein
MITRRVLAFALAVTTAVLVVASGLLAVLDRDAPLGTSFGSLGPQFFALASMVATGSVGFVVAVRRPRNPIGWILGASALVGALQVASGTYAAYGIAVHPASVPGAPWAAWLANWIGRENSSLNLLAFLLFPTGALASRRWRPALILPPLVAIGFFSRAFVPGPMRVLGVENPVGLSWVPQSIDDGGLGGVPLIVGSVVALASLRARYVRADNAEREQIKWLLLPVILLFVALVATVTAISTDTDHDPLGGAIVGLLNALPGLVLPVCMGIAILRYRLYDIDVLINRALVYGATTVGIAVAFFAGIVVLQALLRPITGGSELAVAASTLASVALFQPLRARVQGAVDRRFYRARYDAARTLDDFSARLRDEVDLDAVRDELVAAVRDTVQPTYASLWLRPE